MKHHASRILAGHPRMRCLATASQAWCQAVFIEESSNHLPFARCTSALDDIAI
jgi:hypothetical protein